MISRRALWQDVQGRSPNATRCCEPAAVEGPFTYRSGWVGRYDPAEGRYLGMDDVYMPRDFDPDSASPRAGS